MRAYIKTKYDNLYSRGGVRIPVDKAPDAQIIAVYYSMMKRDTAKAMQKNVTHTLKKDKQYMFNF
jgi:hypothetical protein